MRVDHARHWAPPWLAAAREGLDHDHAGAAAWARARQHTEGVRRDIRLLWWVSRRDDMEQCAGCRDVLRAVGVGKEPIVADAVEALGQHVHQEAPDKLMRVKPHGLPAARAVDAIVLPTERDAGLVSGNEAAVRDGDTMRVTGEIAQYLLGSRERRLAVDYPVDAPQHGDEALERPLLGKPGMRVEKRQLAAVVRIHEHRQYLCRETGAPAR